MKYFLLLLATVAIFSCKKSEDEGGLTPSKNLSYTDSALVAQFMHEQIGAINRDTQIYIDTVPIYSRVLLPRIYEQVNMLPIWLDSTNLHQAVKLLENSIWDGLDPKDYHLREIRTYYDLLQKNSTRDYELLTKLDILLTDGIILYSYHLMDGKLDPLNFNPTWDSSRTEIPENADKLLLDALQERNVKEKVLGFRPDHIFYDDMMKSLRKYMGLSTSGGWPIIAVPKDSTVRIEPGDSHELIPEIRYRLSIEGDFPDSEELTDNKYDKTLEKAVKSFQLRHGLLTDGVIGNHTISRMNTPVFQKVIQIKVAMERARWVLNDLSQDLILVNIPQFRLMYYENNQQKWESRVIIGKKYTSTPVFSDSIQYLVFNPTWTLPNSIATNEILPQLKSDPGYLDSRNMGLYTFSGNEVNPSSVNFDSLSKDNFPYYIQQSPGVGNALGRVKFLFPNKYSVYLHDTPSKHLFGKQERAFSHGCIRLQDPLEFAIILLNNEENWNREKINEIIDSGETVTVNVPQPYPILIQYWTHLTEQNGTAYFLSDIYNRDNEVWEGLKAPVYSDHKRPKIYQ